ncbi:MAG: hypothetical protein ACLTYI_09715 [Christensenellales bacterium]
MKITIKKLGQYPWLEGTVEGHHFQAAVYDEPSVYGINEGRITSSWYGRSQAAGPPELFPHHPYEL